MAITTSALASRSCSWAPKLTKKVAISNLMWPRPQLKAPKMRTRLFFLNNLSRAWACPQMRRTSRTCYRRTSFYQDTHTRRPYFPIMKARRLGNPKSPSCADLSPKSSTRLRVAKKKIRVASLHSRWRQSLVSPMLQHLRRHLLGHVGQPSDKTRLSPTTTKTSVTCLKKLSNIWALKWDQNKHNMKSIAALAAPVSHSVMFRSRWKRMLIYKTTRWRTRLRSPKRTWQRSLDSRKRTD